MKKTARIQIPYGTAKLEFSLPAARLLGIVQNRPARLPDPDKLIAAALEGLDRKECPFAGKDVLIVVSDLTRHAHVDRIIPRLLDKIGAAAGKIEIIIGSGLHRPHTEDELIMLLGRAARERYTVINHAQDELSLADFGVTDTGIPRILNKRLRGRDIVITLGVIEPHLYAGYSGGAKTLAIGLAGEATINATHGIKFLDDPTVRIGSIDGNAFQDALWKIAYGIVPRWTAINVVNDPDGNLMKVMCGEVRSVFTEGARFARKLFEVTVDKEADIAILGIGHPKDMNLYQASRAMNYILNVKRPIVKRGGVVIIAAELSDGMGSGTAEKRFTGALRDMVSPEEFIGSVKKDGCMAGVHRAYMVARALADYRIIMVSGADKNLLKGLPFPSFSKMDDAIAYAETIVGKSASFYVVPRSLVTIAGAKLS